MMAIFDLYGRTSGFYYRKLSYYSTTIGQFLTFLFCGIIITYFAFLLDETLSRKYPEIVKFAKVSSDEDEKITLIADFPALFEPEKNIFLEKNKNESIINMQFSIGFVDTRTNRYRVIDPRYFDMNVTNYIKNSTKQVSKQMYYENCPRFFKYNKTDFINKKLNKTYCIYSEIELDGETLFAENTSFLNIDIKKCKNNTNIYLNKIHHPDYVNIVQRYLVLRFPEEFSDLVENNIPSNSTNIPPVSPSSSNSNSSLISGSGIEVSPSISPSPSSSPIISPSASTIIPSASTVVSPSTRRQLQVSENYTEFDDRSFIYNNYLAFPKEEYNYLIQKYINVLSNENKRIQKFYFPTNANNTGTQDIKVNPYKIKDRLLQLTSTEVAKNIVCAPSEDINQLLSHLKVVIISLNNNLNITTTSPDSVLIQRTKQESYYTSPTTKVNMIYSYSNTYLESHYSLIPRFLQRNNEKEYAFSLISSNYFVGEINPDDGSFFSIIVKKVRKEDTMKGYIEI